MANADTPLPDVAGAVVVGVDGSQMSDRAVEWAARHAALDDRPLVLVHAVPPLGGAAMVSLGGAGLDVAEVMASMRDDARHLLVAAAARVRESWPDLRVTEVLRVGDAREVLLELSERAEMVVVGSRGRGPVASLLLGSVSVAVFKHATCPVVVVRRPDPTRDRQGVLVGVDGTARSVPALEFAYHVAATGGLPLTVVHCFFDVVAATAGSQVVPESEGGDELDDVRVLVSESIAGLSEKYPDVEVTQLLARGLVDESLVRLSADKELLVLGWHRSNPLASLVFGSVTPAVVERAHTTVAVVPAPD